MLRWPALLLALLLATTPEAGAASAPTQRLDQARFLLISEDALAPVAGRPGDLDPDDPRWQVRALPDHWDVSGPYDGGQGWYELAFAFDPEAHPDTLVWALYVPKHNRQLDLFVNGEPIATTAVRPGKLANNWVHPFLFQLPAGLLRDGRNDVHVRLYGHNYDTTLAPLYFGPEQDLVGSYRARYAFHVGAAQVTVGWMAIVALAMFLFWRQRRSETQYLWFGMACIAAAVLSLDRILRDLPEFLTNTSWVIMFNGTVAIYSLFLIMFLHRFLRLHQRRLEAVFAAVIVFYFAFALPAGAAGAPLATNTLHLASAAMGVWMLATLFRYRQRNDPVDSWAVLGVCVFVYGLNINDLLLRALEPPHADVNLLQWSPILLSLAMLWLMFARLLRTLAELETTHAELAERAEAIAESATADALRRERTRLAGDLHDGLGAQLVRAMGQVRGAGDAPPTALATLRAALQDLRLVVYAMDAQGDELGPMLGRLRDQLEEQLAGHGIDLAWRIDPDARVPALTPSARVDLVRVLQEAVTNVVRHAGASEVVVRAADGVVEVHDDGSGFATGETAEGVGMRSMARRAARMGAELRVASSPAGTSVTLAFPDAA